MRKLLAHIAILLVGLVLSLSVSLSAQSDTLIFHPISNGGLDSARLHLRLDSIIQLGLDSAAFPGAQLLVARKGAVIYNKCFGFHTDQGRRPVLPSNLYDLASVTKTLAGTLALMKLYDEGRLDLDATLSAYLPYFKKSNKADLTIRSILAHQAKLKPYIVFWADAKRKNGKYKWRTFKSKQTKRFPIKITDQLYVHRKFKKRIYKGVRDSELLPDAGYRYSGLAFLLFPDLVQQLSGQPFDHFLNSEFYKPLGANHLVFNPSRQFPLSELIPTEHDSFFRHQLVYGSVHDENAALLGGLSSNAGLFGNATDLTKLLQMLLNKGSYGGRSYLSPETIEAFTRCQLCEDDNRRGLGFDKPLIEYNPLQAYTAESASPTSYGHSGFTGTFYWVDPEEELIVVFLSNRVYPTRENRKLYSLNIRPSLHQAVYDAIVE